ncbi:MAG: sulfatase-like hydrolase/transferase, partial [Myxococcota bacterium]|nr:sulfatase-like hydrolase/transferase [Myxococcota bacterium]
RGFDWWRSARNFGKLYGADYVDALGAALDAQAPIDQPLFLFLNIADAHQPWSAVPSSASGLTPQPAMHPRMEDVFRGHLTGADLEAHFEKTRQAYAWGVRRADDTLGLALEALEERGWSETGMRLVVVSDHGEFLGEHGLVDHGRYLWEENQRVFMVHAWRGPGAPDLGSLPRRLAGRHAYDLALEGRLPGAMGTTTAVAFPDVYWQELSDGRLGGSLSAAVWAGDEKLLWQDGQVTRFDLSTGERTTGATVERHPLRSALGGLVERARSSAGAPTAYDPELLEQLQAAGYMEAELGDEQP